MKKKAISKTDILCPSSFMFNISVLGKIGCECKKAAVSQWVQLAKRKII